MAAKPQELADEVVNQHRAAAVEKARGSINGIYDTLVVESKKELAVLPEPIFKEHFLPYFTGKLKVEENKAIVAEWVSIAGSPMAEVSVINESGEQEFVVPPLFDSSVIESVKNKLSLSFSDIYSQYMLHSRNLPVVGEKYLADAFSDKIGKTLKPSETQTVNQEKWSQIFDRYQPADVKVTSVKKQISSNDDVDYD